MSEGTEETMGAPMNDGVGLLTSPGESYLTRVCSALSQARYFCLLSGFVSEAGLAQIAPSLHACFVAGGHGRMIVAVDRQGFNAAPMFERLLALKSEYDSQFSIGVVQGLGLMHAKALFSETHHGNELIVGSANLTRAAFSANQEIGVAVRNVTRNVRQAFNQFEARLHPKELSLEGASEFLVHIGVSRAPHVSSSHPSRSARPLAIQTLAELKPRPRPAVPAGEELRDWAQAGFIVGIGRRESEASVLRVPMQQLQDRGLITSTKLREVGASSYERRSSAYGVLLLPRTLHEQCGRYGRQIAHLRTKVSLPLPCFGEWMPRSYWSVFQNAIERKRSQALSNAELFHEASVHRAFLIERGLDVEVKAIVQGLLEARRVEPTGLARLTDALQAHFRHELSHRTPELIARCLDFRCVRQLWSPHEQTDEPLRAFAADVIHACFATTLRTGEWPHRFRSEVASALMRDLRERMGSVDIEDLPEHAAAILHCADRWDDAETSLDTVAAEFRDLFMKPEALPEIDVSTLLTEDEELGGTDDL